MKTQAEKGGVTKLGLQHGIDEGSSIGYHGSYALSSPYALTAPFGRMSSKACMRVSLRF